MSPLKSRLILAVVGLTVSLGGCVIPLHSEAKAEEPKANLEQLTAFVKKKLDRAGRKQIVCWSKIRVPAWAQYEQRIVDRIEQRGALDTIKYYKARIGLLARFCDE